MTTTTEKKMAPQEEKLNVTKEQYGALQAAFDYFNKELFANKLPRIMLTFSRRSRALGFFVPHNGIQTTTRLLHTKSV